MDGTHNTDPWQALADLIQAGGQKSSGAQTTAKALTSTRSSETITALREIDSLDDDPKSFRKVVRAMMEDSVTGGYGWVMSGGTGTGKTVRAMLAAKLTGIRFKRADDMVIEFAASGKDADLFEVGCLGLGRHDHRYQVDDLVIDDLGRELPEVVIFGNRRDVMREILERRLDAWPHIRTYVTTNLTFEQLGRRYGERIMSRLGGSTLWLPMRGGDRRITGKTGWPKK